MTSHPHSQPSSPEAPTLLALEAREAGYKKRIEELKGALGECLGQMGWTNYTDEEMRHEAELGNGRAPLILRARAALKGAS